MNRICFCNIIKGFLAQNSAMNFSDMAKIELCNTIANYLEKNGLGTQADFSKYLRGLTKEQKARVGTQILDAYDTGRQYGLREAFSKLTPKSRWCMDIDTVTWTARYEIYHSMKDAFRNSRSSRKFVSLLRENLASGKFRHSSSDDEMAYPCTLEREDDEFE